MNQYVVFVMNADGSKSPIQNYDADSNTLAQVQTAVAGMDQANTYSIELHIDSCQTVIS